MKKNWDLLLDTFEKILDHPESWNQSTWANTCGTAYCFAGHAALLAGGKQLRVSDLSDYLGGDIGSRAWSDYVTLPEERQQELYLDSGYQVRTDDGEPAWSMSQVGRHALGLSTAESDALFRGSNTVEVIFGLLLGFMASEVGDGDYDFDDPAVSDWHSRLFWELRDKVTAFSSRKFYSEVEEQVKVVVKDKVHAIQQVLDEL